MRARTLSFGPGLLLLLFLVVVATHASAQGLFWVGGSGNWDDAGHWAAEEDGIPGAGVPDINTFTQIIDDAATPQTITFLDDGEAEQLHLSLTDAEYIFDLGGNVFDVDLTLQLDALFNETGQLSIDGGQLEAGTLAATSHPLGVAELSLGPNLDVQLFPKTSLPGKFVSGARLDANGQGATILVEGTVILNESAIGPEASLVLINDGAAINVVAGTLFNEGSLHVGSDLGNDDPNTSGLLVVTDGGNLDNKTEALVGREGNGTVQILDGSTFVSRGETTLGVESTGLGFILVESAVNTASWLVLEQVTVGDAGNGTLSLGSGGQMLVSQAGADVHLGEQPGGDGVLFVQSQGLFDTVNSVFVGGSDAAAGGAGQFVVDSGGAASVDGQIKLWGDGTLASEGGAVTAGQILTTSGATVRVAGGGNIETNFLDMAAGTDLDLVDGELAVVGPGATMLVGDGDLSFGSTTAQPTLRLQDASANVDNWLVGVGAGEDARTLINGEQATMNATFDVRVGGYFSDADGTLEILGGGRATAGDDITLAQAANSSASVVVQGVSGGQRSLLRLNATGSDEEIEVGRRGVATMDILDGALVQSLNNFSIGSFAEGDGTTTVGGSSGSIPSQLSVSQDLAVGGFASFDGIGGTGRLIVEVPGEVIVGDLTKFFAAGEGQVMAGARLSTDRLHLIGGSLQNDGIIDVGGTGLTAADGELLVSPTGELVVDGGSHELGALRLEPGSTFDFRSGALSFAGGTMQFPDTSYVYGSASGLPTFEFTDGALAEVTFVWRVGGLVDTAGLTRLQNPGTRLANTGGGGGADLSVGYAGSGFMEIFDGAEVDFNDDVIIGWLAGSLGSVMVSGVDTERARIFARGGSDNDMIVGRAGDADLTVVDGAYAFAADDVLVGSSASGNGYVTVVGSAGGFAATLEAGDDLFVGGGAPPTDFGTGVVGVFEGGEVIVGDFTYVGPGDRFDLLGGTLRTGNLSLGGELSRLDWQSGTLDLTASGVVVNAAGLLGADLVLATNMTLRTEGAIDVVDGSTLTLSNGTANTNDDFYLEDGCTLQGDGTVQAAGILDLHGSLEPGSSPGTLTLVGNVLMNSTAVTSVEIGGLVPGSEHDQIVVDGDLTLAGLLEVSLVNGFTLEAGQTFLVAEVSGTLSGNFGGLADETVVANLGGTDLYIDYNAGDGNDVALYTAGTAVSAPDVPASFRMSIAPNPFNPMTTVMLDLPGRGDVEVDVYNIRGALVRRLMARELDAGRHELRFDGTDMSGRRLASGAYLVRAMVGGEQYLHKITLLK